MLPLNGGQPPADRQVRVTSLVPEFAEAVRLALDSGGQGVGVGVRVGADVGMSVAVAAADVGVGGVVTVAGATTVGAARVGVGSTAVGDSVAGSVATALGGTGVRVGSENPTVVGRAAGAGVGAVGTGVGVTVAVGSALGANAPAPEVAGGFVAVGATAGVGRTVLGLEDGDGGAGVPSSTSSLSPSASFSSPDSTVAPMSGAAVAATSATDLVGDPISAGAPAC
jgi:hypothetical protein